MISNHGKKPLSKILANFMHVATEKVLLKF
jgi:hypothetical protein